MPMRGVETRNIGNKPSQVFNFPAVQSSPTQSFTCRWGRGTWDGCCVYQSAAGPWAASGSPGPAGCGWRWVAAALCHRHPHLTRGRPQWQPHVARCQNSFGAYHPGESMSIIAARLFHWCHHIFVPIFLRCLIYSCFMPLYSKCSCLLPCSHKALKFP